MSTKATKTALCACVCNKTLASTARSASSISLQNDYKNMTQQEKNKYINDTAIPGARTGAKTEPQGHFQANISAM